MDFKIDKLDDFNLVQVLKEKLDTSIAPGLKSELVLLSGNNEKNILLDLSKCTYCDSSGLSAILVANRLCKNRDRKSTRLNSSHVRISYAVFCLKKKKKKNKNKKQNKYN